MVQTSEILDFSLLRDVYVESSVSKKVVSNMFTLEVFTFQIIFLDIKGKQLEVKRNRILQISKGNVKVYKKQEKY